MKIGRGVSELWRVENRPLPLTWPMAYTTACTTVQAVIKLCNRRDSTWQLIATQTVDNFINVANWKPIRQCQLASLPLKHSRTTVRVCHDSWSLFTISNTGLVQKFSRVYCASLQMCPTWVQEHWSSIRTISRFMADCHRRQIETDETFSAHTFNAL